MSGVKPSRSYNSDRRREQARQTRLAVLDAGRRLFLEEGYAATTLAMVAREAGVSVETIYKVFGGKPALVKAIFDVAIAGDDEPVPMFDREFVRRNMAEPDPHVKLREFGAFVAVVGDRVNPIQILARDAAGTDTAAAEVWEQMQGERLTGMAGFAQHLRESGALRAGVSEGEARDVLWTHSSVELWDLLVNQRGWGTKRYGRWVGQQLVAALL
jgi:AcrR family transcriptional regulator